MLVPVLLAVAGIVLAGSAPKPAGWIALTLYVLALLAAAGHHFRLLN